ncbi:MAG TPA: PPOX class F420-dependent oxidoreductase [Tepidiformaceae bacterium]|jgi:PPOX class probable F420-dependent enzyme|nr:PPOX class F420-dependent oxidoreductase [Thermoflexaceae bacterium]HMS57792.1 PPOX class F420-dependent oxidoreductase [Tepidiformaceae bacterium]
MVSIPQSHRDIFEGKNFAHIATLMPDGSPQNTPVWIDLDGDTLVINTVVGRQKARNLDRDGRVALSVFDGANPYRYVQVRGRVAGKTTDGADAHIDAMAKKYMGLDSYPYRNDADKRVIYRIEPEHVQTMG